MIISYFGVLLGEIWIVKNKNKQPVNAKRKGLLTTYPNFAPPTEHDGTIGRNLIDIVSHRRKNNLQYPQNLASQRRAGE